MTQRKQTGKHTPHAAVILRCALPHYVMPTPCLRAAEALLAVEQKQFKLRAHAQASDQGRTHPVIGVNIVCVCWSRWRHE